LGLETLKGTLINHAYLKKIDISNVSKPCGFGEEELFVINEILKKSKVESIVISCFNPYLLDGSKVLEILKDTLMNHKYIKNIDLSSNSFEDKDCLFLNDILKNPSIEKINLRRKYNFCNVRKLY
jgi:hypothetical protein